MAMNTDVSLLRETARLVRTDLVKSDRVRISGRTFALAIADWLDMAGADVWAYGPLCECGTGCDACDDNLWEPHARDALAVARAYMATR